MKHVEEDNIIVASDVHIPYHNERLTAQMLGTAERRGAEAIVWLGDLMDNPTFSSWGQDDLSTTFKRELKIAEGLIRLASTIVDRQYWSFGNHEARWMRKNGEQVDMELLANMAGLSDLVRSGHLVMSDHPSLLYRDDWYLTHPSTYGSVPLVVPGKLAELFSKNVVSAHAHHWGMGTSPTGRFTVIESGGLFNPLLVKYVQQRVTTHRQWVGGYVALDRGVPTLFQEVK
jgi:predicted phosphodiesterase